MTMPPIPNPITKTMGANTSQQQSIAHELSGPRVITRAEGVGYCLDRIAGQRREQGEMDATRYDNGMDEETQVQETFGMAVRAPCAVSEASEIALGDLAWTACEP